MKDLMSNAMQTLIQHGKRLYARVDRSVVFPFYRALIRILDRRCEEKIRAYGLVSDWKERSLQEFRLWLADMPQTPPSEGDPGAPDCDLYTLLAEFAGLRNEIKFQNREQAKAVKAISGFVDGCSETFELLRRSSSDLRHLEHTIARSAEKNCLLPFFDVRDTLVRSMDALANRKAGQGIFSRGKAELDMGIDSLGIALRRFDRALSCAGITPVETVGNPFDPKTMNAVSVVPDAGKPDGQVLEQLCGGYVRDNDVLVVAQVVVSQLSN